MKTKFLFTLLIMILPLAISPATGSVTSIMEPQEIPSAIVEMVAPGYEKSDAPYLAEWRNTRDSFEIPDIDLSLEKPEITIGDANDYLLTIEDLETDSVDLDGKPCSTCLKESRGIIIDEAKDLRRLNGKGTIDDPYVITGLAFIDDRKNALQIQDVGGYFLITGNEFRGSESGLFSDLILSNIAGSVSITGNNFTGVNSIGIMSSNVGAVEMYGNNVFGYNGESVTISGSSNVVISGNSIYNNAYGVVVDSSTSGSIDNNNIYSNTGNGITLSFSSNFAIDSNTIFNNGGDGIFLQDSNANTISNNNVYSNGPGAATLELESTRMVTYSGGSFNLEGFFGSGIYLDPSFDNDITGNIVENNAAFGVFLEFSDRTTIDTNTISGNDLSGIFFLDTDASAVINNIIANNGQGGTSLAPNMNLSPMESRMLAGFFGSGIYLDPSFNNEINGNTITNSGGDGLFLEFSDSNTINGNTITDNGFTGISFLDSDDNVISANQIAGNGASGASLLMNANLSPFETRLINGFFGSGIYLDPSHRNTVDGNVLMNNVGSGVFLLESTTTGISNNQILSNGGEGVLLINSSQNAIDSNLVDSNGLGSAALIRDSLNADNLKLHGFFGSGIYLDPSPFNNVTNNVITNSAGAGVYFLETNYSRIADNFISGSGDSAIAFVDSSFNEIISNAIENNGAAAASLAIGLDGFFGSGIYLDPSHFNNIIGNNVSGSAGDGFASESSTNSHVQDNRFFENLGYGVNLDVASSNSFVGSNNFQDNTANKQARDDGIFNAFSNNFWSDGNNTDANYDGIADDPYNVDGNAGTTDSTASNIPKGLNFYTAQIVEVTPTKINAGSEGTPVTFKIELTDGFRALNIDVTNSWLNGTVQAESFHVIDILRFTVTFPRQQVNDLINSLGLVEPFFVTLEAVILMNDGLLEVTASDLVEVNQSEGGMVLVLGLSGSMVTAVGVRRESKYTKALSKLRSIFNK